ncbi:hypothetical protein BU15DRAFT_66724 [Melanogaster broomeanus]|nr:hypothetical protein BU15DRAFT_66724 [Melanogaster broomeanus]
MSFTMRTCVMLLAGARAVRVPWALGSSLHIWGVAARRPTIPLPLERHTRGCGGLHSFGLLAGTVRLVPLVVWSVAPLAQSSCCRVIVWAISWVARRGCEAHAISHLVRGALVRSPRCGVVVWAVSQAVPGGGARLVLSIAWSMVHSPGPLAGTVCVRLGGVIVISARVVSY